MRFRNTPSVVVEIRCIGFWRAALAECVGTFLLCVMVTGSWLQWPDGAAGVPSGAAGVPSGAGRRDEVAPRFTDARLLSVSVCAGLAVTALVQGFGHISGGHLNPAVTSAMLCGRKISPLRAIVYIIAQCTGAVAGSLLLYGITPVEYQGTLAVTAPGVAVSRRAAVVVETLLSFLHVFTISATVDPFVQIPGSASLAIGLAVTASHIVGLRFSGCSLNPARSLGPAVVTGFWKDHWIYWAGPIGGAVLAMLVYDYIFNPSSQSNNICGTDSVYELGSSQSTLAPTSLGGGDPSHSLPCPHHHHPSHPHRHHPARLPPPTHAVLSAGTGDTSPPTSCSSSNNSPAGRSGSSTQHRQQPSHLVHRL